MPMILKKIKLWFLRIRGNVEKYPVYHAEIEKLLNKKFKGTIEIEDTKYYTCDYETAKTIASLIPTRFLKYKKETWDCDNFSKLFWAIAGVLFPRLPVGRCNVKRAKGLHSLNCILYRTKSGRLSFSFIEPQTGKLSYWNYQPYIIIV